MGVFKFYSWFKRTFSSSITRLKRNQRMNVSIDNLAIDMNGIFHKSCQKIYKYGEFKEVNVQPLKQTPELDIDVFKDICNEIDILLRYVRPRKRLLLMVDGVAGMCKMSQQRKRRFKNHFDTSGQIEGVFDPNSLSPGTLFMRRLVLFIEECIMDYSIRDYNRNLEVVLSSELVPNEGEHKCMIYLRHNCALENNCIYGLDADLIMISLISRLPHMYILRDNVDYNRGVYDTYYLIDISITRLLITSKIDWTEESYTYKNIVHLYNINSGITDFVFLLFTMGNDFLPNLMGVEIINEGIDIIIKIIRDIGINHGHITYVDMNGSVRFNKHCMRLFFEKFTGYEKIVLEKKLKMASDYYPDKLLESCALDVSGEIDVDIDKYRKKHFKKHFGSMSKRVIHSICSSYLDGLQFVLSYYTNNRPPDWHWYFKYNYAPSSYYLLMSIDKYDIPRFVSNKPILPFQQLIYIMPCQSMNILPRGFDALLSIEDMKDIYDISNIKIDYSGKKNEYEAVIILPAFDLKTLLRVYSCMTIDKMDMRRNIEVREKVLRKQPHIRHDLNVNCIKNELKK